MKKGFTSEPLNHSGDTKQFLKPLFSLKFEASFCVFNYCRVPTSCSDGLCLLSALTQFFYGEKASFIDSDFQGNGYYFAQFGFTYSNNVPPIFLDLGVLVFIFNHYVHTFT